VLNFINTLTYYSESAEPQDYVDLAEETEFHPEIQEGRQRLIRMLGFLRTGDAGLQAAHV